MVMSCSRTAVPVVHLSQSRESWRPARMISCSEKTPGDGTHWTVRRYPAQQISWTLNLGLDKKTICTQHPQQLSIIPECGNPLVMAKRPLTRRFGLPRPLQDLADDTVCYACNLSNMNPLVPFPREPNNELQYFKYLTALSELCKIQTRKSFQSMGFEWIKPHSPLQLTYHLKF